jgi:hypothetical protein
MSQALTNAIVSYGVKRFATLTDRANKLPAPTPGEVSWVTETNDSLQVFQGGQWRSLAWHPPTPVAPPNPVSTIDATVRTISATSENNPGWSSLALSGLRAGDVVNIEMSVEVVFPGTTQNGVFAFGMAVSGTDTQNADANTGTHRRVGGAVESAAGALRVTQSFSRHQTISANGTLTVTPKAWRAYGSGTVTMERIRLAIVPIRTPR